jgi:hypothetical protein
MSLQDTGGRDSAHSLLPSMAHSLIDEIVSNLGELEDDQNLPFMNGGVPFSIHQWKASIFERSKSSNDERKNSRS